MGKEALWWAYSIAQCEWPLLPPEVQAHSTCKAGCSCHQDGCTFLPGEAALTHLNLTTKPTEKVPLSPLYSLRDLSTGLTGS